MNTYCWALLDIFVWQTGKEEDIMSRQLFCFCTFFKNIQLNIKLIYLLPRIYKQIGKYTSLDGGETYEYFK